MKIYNRFRFALMAFALGLAAVYMANGLRIARNQVPVKLPETRSGEALVVTPAAGPYIRLPLECPGDGASGPDDDGWIKKKIFESRDMNLYESGGHYDNQEFLPIEKQITMEAALQTARQFVWSHWKDKKRGYLIVFTSGIDAASNAHIFIEPDQNGRWQITWYWERLYGIASCYGDVDKMPPIRRVKRVRAADENWQADPKLVYLKMTDENGDDFSL